MGYSQAQLRDLASRWLDPARVLPAYRVVTDTTDFYRVDYDDIALLGGRPYLIRNNEREGRFGIDEQQKFWVKRAVDLIDGSRKVIKLVYHERFKARVGPLVFDCVRSPAKEGRVLDLVSSHPNFMHGHTVFDSAGNVVRIIDYIQGTKLSDAVANLVKPHERYFVEDFPGLLRGFIDTVEGICYIHEHGELHGDVRRDHIFIDAATSRFRWIDFDFVFHHHEFRFGYDLFGLGNILAFLVGGRDLTVQLLSRERPVVFSRLTPADLNIIFHNRLVNLRKVFPYVPEPLNDVLMHFSGGNDVFYSETRHFLEDLMEAGAAVERCNSSSLKGA